MIFKNYKKTKILALLLAAISLFSACSGKANNNNNPEKSLKNVRESSYYFIEQGGTDYIIVYPQERGSYVDIAVEELCEIIAESTGIYMSAIPDTGLTHTSENKYISLGNTSLLASSGLNTDTDTLGGDGYKIMTKDKSVYLYANTTHGVLYAAYEFLYHQFGFEFFAEDSYSLEKNVINKKLLDFDYIDIPSIAARFMADGTLNYNNQNAQRLRSTPVDLFLVAPAKGRWHTSQGLIDIDLYFDETDTENYHPEFFQFNLPEEKSTNTGQHSHYEAKKNYPTTGVDEDTAKKNQAYIDGKLQLCYSGRPASAGLTGKNDGTPADQTPLVNAIVNSMKTLVDAYIVKNTDDNDLMIGLTQMDNFDWCECDYCLADIAEYGTKSAGYIVVANKVAEIMHEYVKNTYNGRELTVFIFAYQETEKPPVREINGKYEPILDGKYGNDIILNEHLLLLYAPIFADYSVSFKHAINEVEDERMKQWRTLSDNIGMWTYGKTFYHDSFIPMNSYNSLIDNMNYYVDNNVNFLHAQGQSWNAQSTEWNDLKTYLNASLAWNHTQNLDTMIDKFFNNFYMDASPYMRAWFDDYRAWHTMQTGLRSWNYRGTASGRKTLDDSFYPYAKLMEWQGHLKDAYTAIEKYKAYDPALYDKLERRITKDGLSLQYMMYNLHESTIGLTAADRIYEQMMKDAFRVGLTECKEDRPLAQLLRTTVL